MNDGMRKALVRDLRLMAQDGLSGDWAASVAESALNAMKKDSKRSAELEAVERAARKVYTASDSATVTPTEFARLIVALGAALTTEESG